MSTPCKYHFIDVETTGVNSWKNGIIQIAGIIEINGKIVEEYNLRTQPHEKDVIEDKALEVNGITRDEISSYPLPGDTYRTLMKIWGKYVQKFQKQDKFTLLGYNSQFDSDFLRAFFTKCGDRYFGSWFHWPDICVARLAMNHLKDSRAHFSDFKLASLAKHYGISGDFHDAAFDIQATREIYWLLEGERNGNA